MRHLSLRSRFLLFALACLVPFSAVLAYTLDRALDQRIEQVYANGNTLASSVSRSTTSFLSANTDALEGIAQFPSVLALDAEDANFLLGNIRPVRPEFSGLFLADVDGNVLASSGTDPETLLPYISPYIEQTVGQSTTSISHSFLLENDANGFVIIVPVVTAQTAEPTTNGEEAADGETASDELSTAPTPVPSGDEDADQSTQPPGQTIGVVGGLIQTDRLGQAILPSSRGDAEIALITADSMILSTGGFDQSPGEIVTTPGDAITLTLEGETTQFELVNTSDMERAAVGQPVSFELAQWAVVVTKPTPAVLDGVSTTELITVIVLCLLVILALAVVLGELTARPIRTMVRQANALNTGTLNEPIVPLGGGEIRQLSEELEEMADATNQQVARLEEHRHDRERQAAQMRDLLRRTNRLQEDERRRIAGEIHDAVSPLITGALYQARALLMTNGSTPEEELDTSLKSVSELLERATNELHDVIFELRPPDLDDLGLVAAIEAYVQTIQRTGLSCRLEVIGETPNFTPEVRLSFYRIAQEALHNVVRHAGADEAVVRLETTDELIRMTVRDNGAGFDSAQAVQPTSLGLLSMRERAESIGATFTIVTRPGGGTAIVIERPNSGDVMSDEVLESMMSMSGSGRPDTFPDSADNDLSPSTSDAPDTVHQGPTT